MAVEQVDVVDFVSFSSERNVVTLTISNHLSWDEKGESLLKVQEKLNTYLRYVEGGELHMNNPSFAGIPVEINIVCEYDPTLLAMDFFHRAKEICLSAGIVLRVSSISGGYRDNES